MGQDTDDSPSISIDGYHLEAVESFTYLGSTISNTLSLDAELNSRIAKASATLAKLNKRVWTNSSLTKMTKLEVYQACVLGTLLYGSEAWTTSATQEKTLNSFHLHCLRRILNIKWKERVTLRSLIVKASPACSVVSIKEPRDGLAT